MDIVISTKQSMQSGQNRLSEAINLFLSLTCTKWLRNDLLKHPVKSIKNYKLIYY